MFQIHIMQFASNCGETGVQWCASCNFIDLDNKYISQMIKKAGKLVDYMAAKLML